MPDSPLVHHATPWRIDFYDGSGNSYRFSQGSAADPVEAVYDPVKAAESSSGTYYGERWALDWCERERPLESCP